MIVGIFKEETAFAAIETEKYAISIAKLWSRVVIPWWKMRWTNVESISQSYGTARRIWRIYALYGTHENE